MADRQSQDMILITGYCRQHTVIPHFPAMYLLEDIFDCLFLFYHIPFFLSSFDWTKLTQSEVTETKKLYNAQCKGLLFDAKQESLWKCLAFSRKNRLPLLPLCIDRFTRDRLSHYYKTKETMSLSEWCNEYKILKYIVANTSHKQSKEEMIRSAMSTFFHRYISFLQLPVYLKYDDSLDAFSDIIIQTTHFIENLMRSDDYVAAPFQIELMIIPKKIVDALDAQTDDEDDDDFDDDFDSDEDSDSDESDDETTGGKAPKDEIPAIAARLDGNVTYAQHKGSFNARRLYDMLQKLKAKEKGAGSVSAIHRERVCIVVDRRNGNQVFMYSPNTLSTVPRMHVTEWYFESSSECIVPGNTQRDIIKANTNANGGVFVLSFHCDARDQVRSYLYTRSQMVRFLPQDIYQLLPHLFVVEDGSANARFVKKETDPNTRDKTGQIRIRDVVYDQFVHQTKPRDKSAKKESFKLK